MSTFSESRSESTDSNPSYPKEHVCHDWSETMKEGIDKDVLESLYTEWAKKSNGSYDERQIMSTFSESRSESTDSNPSYPKEHVCHDWSETMKEGIDKDVLESLYTEWAKKSNGSYDEKMAQYFYSGSYYVAKAVNDNCPDKNIRILDIACGTGFVGQHLNHFGFSNVDGMDASSGMLEKAKEKHVYKNHFCSAIGPPNPPTDIPDRTYDVITICGGLGPGHIPCEAVDEMIRIVKPGGLIVNITRAAIIERYSDYKDKWEPYIAKKEEEQKWREVCRTNFKNYCFGKDGIMYIHEVL